jgi:hypothetical protein
MCTGGGMEVGMFGTDEQIVGDYPASPAVVG